MFAFTANQWAIVALVFVLGWLLGLLSRPSGARWKRDYERERDAHAARIKAANARIAELERDRHPISAGTATAVAAAASGGRDDLSLIRGIGHPGETRLNEFGVHRYRDITALSQSDEAALEGRLGAEPGTIAREHWRDQAALLADRKLDEHARRYP